MDVNAVIGVGIAVWLAGLAVAFVWTMKARHFRLAFGLGTPIVVITALVLFFRI